MVLKGKKRVGSLSIIRERNKIMNCFVGSGIGVRRARFHATFRPSSISSILLRPQSHFKNCETSFREVASLLLRCIVVAAFGILIFLVQIESAWTEASTETFSYEYQIFEDTDVFSKPDLRSEKQMTLEAGEKVMLKKWEPIGNKSTGRFIEVFYESELEEGFQSGFVPTQKINRNLISRVGNGVRTKAPGALGNRIKSERFMGLGLGFSYLSQSKAEFEMSDFTTYEIETLQSITPYFELAYGGQLSERFFLVGSVNYRTTSFEGKARQKNGAPGLAPYTIIKKQTLLGGSLFLQRLLFGTRLWMGAGGELGLGQSVLVKVNGEVAPTSDQDKPFFAMGLVGFGYKFHPISRLRIRFEPEIRFGVIGSTTPLTLLGQAQLNIQKVW